jgi:serine/threonine protein kinase
MEPLHIQVDLPSCNVSLECQDEDSYEVTNFNEIQFPDFQYVKTLGNGSYSSVVKCCFRVLKSNFIKFNYFIKGRLAAAKIFKSDIDQSYLLDEAKHLHRLRHPNIISFYALFHGEKFGIVVELMEGGSLNECIL